MPYYTGYESDEEEIQGTVEKLKAKIKEIQQQIV